MALPRDAAWRCRMIGSLYIVVEMYYVYFLLLNNGQVYTGFTSDPKQRVAQHNAGRVSSTKKYLPLTLLGYEAYCLKTDAQRRERFMKTTEGKRLFRHQYRDIILQLSKNYSRASSSAG